RAEGAEATIVAAEGLKAELAAANDVADALAPGGEREHPLLRCRRRCATRSLFALTSRSLVRRKCVAGASALSGGHSSPRPRPRRLPPAIFANGDADAPIADLGDRRSPACLDQPVPGPDREAVDLAPLPDRHHARVVKRTGELKLTVEGWIGLRALPLAAFCFPHCHVDEHLVFEARHAEIKKRTASLNWLFGASRSARGFSPSYS